MPYMAKEDIDDIMFTSCVLHNILLDHDARECTIVDDLEEVSLPAAKYSLAGRSNVTDFRYMSGPNNNIREDESEAERTIMTCQTSRSFAVDLIQEWSACQLSKILLC